MPRVPYSGVPEIAPGGVPLSRYRADVSETTFGGNVGAALSGLGGTLQRSGEELFQRGKAMQELFNASEANEAAAQYTQLAGQREIDYKLSQGKDAVLAYPQYSKDLADLRTTVRKGVTSPDAQRLFDNETRRTFSSLTLSGAGHAATQNRNFAVNSSEARAQSIDDMALANPLDERTFALGLENKRREATVISSLKYGAGPDDDITKENVAQAVSSLWSKRIDGLLKIDPMAAGRMLSKAIDSGEVRGSDIGKLNAKVQQAQDTVGARNISQDITTGAGGRFGAGVVDLVRARDAIGTFESGGRYHIVGVEVTDKAGNTGRALGKYQVMSYNLAPWLAAAGLPAMSEAEFLKNPKAQDAVFDHRFGGYMQKYGSFNAAATAWFAGEGSVGKDGAGLRDAHGTNVPAYIRNTNAILARNAPLSERTAMGTTLAREQAPNNPLLPEYVEQRVLVDHAQEQRIRADAIDATTQTLNRALVGLEPGKAPTTIEGLTADPAVAKAWERLGELDPVKQLDYRKALAQNAKGEVFETADTMRLSQRYRGFAENDPAGFLKVDIPGLPLPFADRKALLGLQEQKRKSAGADPQVTSAMTILKPMLHAAKIDKDSSKDLQNQFTGALRDAMHQFIAENKRPPRDEEVQKIGARLLQITTPGGWFSSDVPLFREPIPAKLAAEFKAARPDLSDADIQRLYTQQRYRELTNPKPMSGAKPTTAAGPVAPSSQ